jgi:general secretion pathway protein I
MRIIAVAEESKNNGFTLIEVLLALAVIAIALTALLKATAQSVTITQRIKEKSISHWVAMQGVTAIQLGVVPMGINQEITEVTKILGQEWYWRAKITSTPIKSTQQISITVSNSPTGPFGDQLIAFKYAP